MTPSSNPPAPPATTDVLIVGAGPAGLALAASLRQLGVDHVLIDRHDDVQPGSKAAAIQPRALEYLDRTGVADRLIQAGDRGRGFRLHDRTQTLLSASYDNLDTPYPFVLLISQQTTETHLLAHLDELGGKVHRGHTFLGYTPDFPGVAATIAGPDGIQRSISARYLIGCDGVHSAVRAATGIGFPGNAPEQLFAIADIRTNSPALPQEDTTFYLSPAGMLLISPLAGGLHRVVGPTPNPATPTADDIRRLLAERGPHADDIQVTEVVSASTYRVQERVAERFSDGPVFLAGDAAHTHSPAGGQGMNTGIQDAGNLAWKLHAVLTGLAPTTLLDTYHHERHPIAAGLVAFTSQFATLANLRDPADGELRNRVLAAAASTPGVTEWIATKLAQLDLGYTNEPDHGPVGTRVSPNTVPTTGLHWTLALDRPDHTGDHGVLAIRHVSGLESPLLVRPDGYLAAYGVPTEPEKVLDQLSSYLPAHPTR
ncbi:FAD-dependent monooxygenase [Amycolatopsis saalfeldensis]|uniref:2-polyprenyl-6-methoxyphenol hydroxylase n=1 Tax=Amycolatopsis saalfeldensis TaxID=394193 RepID=A0A1H8YNW0_9PSEU|nr:FAD-dependent monooxygenase [Amycolatopsis saalfeldensis]SEP53894.1 2-polyprenyl-6-methoxyphenol hydroxylase [Amycolatopsis saalfeldensis]